MIAKFEEVKGQLKELAEVINAFKSEAVQLRIIDIVFGLSTVEEAENTNSHEPPQPVPSNRRKRSKRKVSSSENTVGNPSGTPEKRKASGGGAVATLVKIFQDGYFAQAHAINDILIHCETNLARKIKANEISGKLARMVRSGELTRSKNADGQYEYKNA